MSGRRTESLGQSQMALGAAAAIASLAYALLRVRVNLNLSWDEYYALASGLPVGHRVLLPILARPLVEWSPLSPAHVFLILEALSTLLLLYVLWRTLADRVGPRAAVIGTGAFLLVLAWPFLPRYNQFISYYPYDTLAVAFTILFVRLVLLRRWGWAIALTALAASNRETADFFPLIAGALGLRLLPLGRLVIPVVTFFVGYAAVRHLIVEPVPATGCQHWGITFGERASGGRKALPTSIPSKFALNILNGYPDLRNRWSSGERRIEAEAFISAVGVGISRDGTLNTIVAFSPLFSFVDSLHRCIRLVGQINALWKRSEWVAGKSRR